MFAGSLVQLVYELPQGVYNPELPEEVTMAHTAISVIRVLLSCLLRLLGDNVCQRSPWRA